MNSAIQYFIKKMFSIQNLIFKVFKTKLIKIEKKELKLRKLKS
jgi:hypothetical protein